MDKEFTKVGKGWVRPRWKQILLWLRWRPYFWLRGEIFHWMYKIADKKEFGPFRRQWWIGAGNPESDEYSWGIKIHNENMKCDCGSEFTGTLHHLAWIPAPDYRWVGDRWWEKDDKMYRWESTHDLEDVSEFEAPKDVLNIE